MMRFLGRAPLMGLVGLALATLSSGSDSYAQAPSCTGNGVVQQAPYSCHASRVISGITFNVSVDLDAAGRAVITYAMSPAQPADVAIAAHSYTGIAGNPHRDVTGTIPAGQTTGQLVISQVECGQLDIKAVSTSPGAAAGRIAGPRVSWGQGCQAVAPTTTTAPTTTAPTTTAPVTTAPTTTAPAAVKALHITASPTGSGTLPSTGSGGVVPWEWSLPILALGGALVRFSRHPRRAPRA